MPKLEMQTYHCPAKGCGFECNTVDRAVTHMMETQHPAYRTQSIYVRVT